MKRETSGNRTNNQATRVTELKPFGTIGDPPTEGERRNSGSDGPPKRQDEIGEETYDGKADPEHLALHRASVAPTLRPSHMRYGVWRKRKPVEGPHTPAESNPGKAISGKKSVVWLLEWNWDRRTSGVVD